MSLSPANAEARFMPKNKRYMITGGAGFIGLSLVKHILKREPTAQILVYDIDKYKRKGLIPSDSRVRIKQSDLRDVSAVRDALSGFQPNTVYHLAAQHFIPECNRDIPGTIDTNLNSTRNIIDTMNSTTPGAQLIFASTAAVYKDKGDDPTPFNEDDPRADIDYDLEDPRLPDIYGATKIRCEDYIRSRAECPVTIARFFNAVGDQDPVPHLLPAIFEQVADGRREIALGNISPVRDYTDTSDFAAALHTLSGQEQERGSIVTLNMGSGIGRSVEDVLHIIGNAALARDTSANKKPLEIKVDPARLRPVDRQYLTADISRIRQAIGWSPQVPFEKTVNTVLEKETSRRKRPTLRRVMV